MKIPLSDRRSLEAVNYVRSDGTVEKQLQLVRRASPREPGADLVLASRPAPEFHSYSTAGSKPVKDTFKPAEGEDPGALKLEIRPQFNNLPQQQPMIHQPFPPQHGHFNQMPQQGFEDPDGLVPGQFGREQPLIVQPERGRMGRPRFRVPQRRRSHHRRRSREPQYYSSGDSGASDRPRLRYLEPDDEWDHKPRMLTSGVPYDDEWDIFKKKQSPMINEGGWSRPKRREYAYY